MIKTINLDFGAYYISEMLRGVCTYMRTFDNLRCSHAQLMDVDEGKYINWKHTAVHITNKTLAS